MSEVSSPRFSRAGALPFFLLTCLIVLSILSGCSGGSGGSSEMAAENTPAPTIKAQEGLAGPTSSVTSLKATDLPADQQPSNEDSARFLSQASFGPTSTGEIDKVRKVGFDKWMEHQFGLSAKSQMAYLEAQKGREKSGKPNEEMAYEAIWQQWLFGEDQLRARTSFALSQIFVVSNIAPDLRPEAMASYMDMLNNHAFGNYRQLLEAVTLHPTMGYYLNMLESEKEDPAKGTHPNENYAREVLQLFSIGLVKLKIDGTPEKDTDGKTIPTYDENVVKGYAKAFSGWSFGGRDTTKANTFHSGEENFTVPMQAWANKHSTASKTLLEGLTLQAGQTPEQDMRMALDSIANHPNVGPFISRRLIQRLVTSNPSPAYIERVAKTFNDNGAGVRGDLRAVVKAVLLDAEARGKSTVNPEHLGKKREPVIRFANLLRAMQSKSTSGHTNIWYLDSADDALGQSPLLAPSVFNFFSPDFKNPGALSAAGLNAPEFQITTDTTVMGGLNFMMNVIGEGGYKGWGEEDSRIKLDFGTLDAVAGDADALVDHMNILFMNGSIRPETRISLRRAINSIDVKLRTDRIKMALKLTMMSPEFVVLR